MFENLFAPRKSETQIKGETEAMGKLIFPHGNGHKEVIEALLYEIDSKKLDKINLMMSFIEGKQQYLKDKNLSVIYCLIKNSEARFRDEQIKEILALVILDTKSDSLKSLPTLSRVKEFAQSLEL